MSEPTAGAMRAAIHVLTTVDLDLVTNDVDACFDTTTVDIAEIIDAETGLAELVAACLYGHDGMDSDILSIMAAWLYGEADGRHPNAATPLEESRAYREMLRGWAGQLVRKQQLECAALAKAKGETDD